MLDDVPRHAQAVARGPLSKPGPGKRRVYEVLKLVRQPEKLHARTAPELATAYAAMDLNGPLSNF